MNDPIQDQDPRHSPDTEPGAGSTPPPWPFPTQEAHPAPAEPAKPVAIAPSEEAIDHGIEESFPASDPVAVTVTTTPDTAKGAVQPPDRGASPAAAGSGDQTPEAVDPRAHPVPPG